MSYLFDLAERLANGLRPMDDERRGRHRAFLLSQQMPDGGFRGREGDADLYYTGFAVRALSVLGTFDADDAGRVAGFLRSHAVESLNVIDLLSWLYSALVVQAATGDDLLVGLPGDFADRTAESLERLRRPDGGYAKAAEGAIGSTYHSFLVALVYELLGRELPRPNALVQFLYDRQRDDGGFVEIDPMKRSGTNPTAAAAALLRQFGGLDDEIREDVGHLLTAVWSNDGGFAANTRIPFPDGLSTFTAVLTAQDLGLARLVRKPMLRHFVTRELEFPTGGFRGAAWDVQADAEYTFYGLGVLGLIGVEGEG